MTTIRYRLTDKNPICMECQQPFDKHDKQQETDCRQHALVRRATYSNIIYLNEGLKQAKVNMR